MFLLPGLYDRNYTDDQYDMYNYNESNNTYEYEVDDDATITFPHQFGNFLAQYYTPVLVLFGSIGNILSVFVFFTANLRRLSSSCYLSAICISDTFFLLGVFVSWLNYVDINIYNRNHYCQFFTYVSELCSFLSVWFVVAFSVDRYIAVLHPLKRQTMCTRKRAWTVVIGMTTVGCLICIPILMLAAPQYLDFINDFICDVREEYKFHANVINYINLVIVFIVPFTSIIMLNMCTALEVWKVLSDRQTITMPMRPNTREVEIPTLHFGFSPVNSDETQIKITKKLILVSSCYVCLNLPKYIMQIKAIFIENDEDSSQYISWILFLTNSGKNFALYCLCEHNFRLAVFKILKKFRKQTVEQAETTTTQVAALLNRRVSNGPNEYYIQEF